MVIRGLRHPACGLNSPLSGLLRTAWSWTLQASTCTHPSHHLPAAGDVCLWYYGAAQSDEIVRARNTSALRLLPSRLGSTSLVGSDVTWVTVTWVRVRMHTTARPAPARAHVATRALWQRIAHARSLAVVLGMTYLRQPVSFDSTVPRVDLARVGHVYQQLPRVSCRVRRSMSACGGLHDEPQAASWSILRHACTAAWLSLWAHKDGHAVTCVRPGPNIAVRVEFTSWPARYPHRREMKQVKIVKRISCACYLS